MEIEEGRSLRCHGRNLMLLPTEVWKVKVKNVPSELSPLVGDFKVQGLMVLLGASLLLIVKCKRTEIY